MIPKLPTLVRDTFKAAQKSGDLTFYQTRVSVLQCNGLPFQVRFSPSLAEKSKFSKPRELDEKPVDPFSEPPKGLFIAELPSHNLVLNKFPIIPDHFILATKEFKEQTSLLEEDDIGAAYGCLQAYRENGEVLFGFFNSGTHSGASQPHRHIQFLPIESMRSGIEAGEHWDVLVDSLVQTPKPDLPFLYFSSALPENPTPKALHDIYIKLHNNACHLLQRSFADPQSTELKSPISYNIGLTDHAIVLCPRASEGTMINSSSGELVGPVALNGTLLGGTCLVKSQAEWDALQGDESKLLDVLSAIGFSPNRTEHGEGFKISPAVISFTGPDPR